MDSNIEQERYLLSYYRYKFEQASQQQIKAKADVKLAKAKFEEQEKIVRNLELTSGDSVGV